MTLTIELTEEQARRVEKAQSKGEDFEYVVHKAIETHLKELDEDEEKRLNAIAYFEARLKERITDPVDLAEAERDTAELLHNLNANRLATGERPLFPE